MHPEIIRIGWFSIQTYGLLLAVSFLIGIALAARRAEKRNVEQKFVLDLSIVIIIAAILGARFLYVIFHLEEFYGHWLDIISPFQSNGEFGIGGLTFLGGLVGAILASIVYARHKGYPFLVVADIFAPSIAVGLIIVRIGCFFNGCCYGVPVHDSIWGVIFPVTCPAGAAYPGILIYPTQLFSSFGALIISLLLLWQDDFRKPAGFTFFLFLVLYGIHRTVIDLFRYYEPSMVMAKIGLPLSVNQGISIVLIIIGVWGILSKGWKPSYR